MSASKWIKLRYEDIAPETNPSDADWVVESPSPYDVPSAVRARYDEETGRLLIEFQYITQEPEPVIAIPIDGHHSFYLGRKSRRIRSVDLDVHRYDQRRVAREIQQAIESLSLSKVANEANRQIAMRAIQGKAGKLFNISPRDLAAAH